VSYQIIIVNEAADCVCVFNNSILGGHCRMSETGVPYRFPLWNTQFSSSRGFARVAFGGWFSSSFFILSFQPSSIFFLFVSFLGFLLGALLVISLVLIYGGSWSPGFPLSS
jgi:hypothetical protein